ncbi:unnamed protein product [Blepharisma stoltei]|uniref:Uncharacterized protein n=1 Tax=Blepharisma stoltei TaxID=1481888 RepID=A0AAU9IWI8_9CILI|nr:unnamed protein product [Blepharisma stoltei]
MQSEPQSIAHEIVIDNRSNSLSDISELPSYLNVAVNQNNLDNLDESNSNDIFINITNCSAPVHPSVYNSIPINELDLGIEPNWELSQTCCRAIYRVEAPNGDARKVYALAQLRNRSSCRVLMSRNREIPVIKEAHYELQPIENTFLEEICSQEELQDFCNGAAIYCKDIIRKLNHLVLFYNVTSYLSLIIFVFLAFLFLALNQVVLTFVLVGLFMLFIYAFHHKFFVFIRGYPEKVNQKLAEYLTFNKINLAQIGINPRPGPFGIYIEFTPYV